MQTLDFFFEIDYVLVDDLESFGGVLPVLDGDLDEERPLLALAGELLGLPERVVLLATDFDGGGHVEDRVLAGALRARLLDQLRDFLGHLRLHVAVQQQRRVVLVVVRKRAQICLVPLARGRVDQLLQVRYQITQLGHLDVALDNVARVQVPDRVHKLL